MKEYIDREAVMQAFSDYVWNSNHSDLVPAPCWNYAVDIVRDIPAADVVEVRHGRLIEDGYYGIPCVCSNCGEPCKDAVIGKPWWNYCPCCGAKMDGGADDDDN